MKVLTIVGARPQFIKAAPVSRAFLEQNNGTRKYELKIKEIFVHTGQHYDSKMSDVFFRELNLPKPHYNLCVGSGTHGWQTGEMIKKIEKLLIKEEPDFALVYGDTNSTLAGALAASKLKIPVAHVEAGLRSYNPGMPEEINRVLTDHISYFLFCPTKTAVENLKKEGITRGVFLIGDVMYDGLIQNLKIAEKKSKILRIHGLKEKNYLLCTIHRAENTDDSRKLLNILDALLKINKLGEIVVFPAHPRTRKQLNSLGKNFHNKFKLIDPVPYLDMLVLEKNAKVVLTDSGGVQKESHWLGVPCITMRKETEWPETLLKKRNILVGTNPRRILNAVNATFKIGPLIRKENVKVGTAKRVVNVLFAHYLKKIGNN